MAQRKISQIKADDLWRKWRADIERIKGDVFELFSSRRTFRDVADVFGNNPRLQDAGRRHRAAGRVRMGTGATRGLS